MVNDGDWTSRLPSSRVRRCLSLSCLMSPCFSKKKAPMEALLLFQATAALKPPSPGTWREQWCVQALLRLILCWIFGTWLRALIHCTGKGREKGNRAGKKCLETFPLGPWAWGRAGSKAGLSLPRSLELSLALPQSDLLLGFPPFRPSRPSCLGVQSLGVYLM